MNNLIDSNKQEKELSQLKEIQKDEYWAKQYNVTENDLTEAGNSIEISAKIIKAGRKNHSFVAV